MRAVLNSEETSYVTRPCMLSGHAFDVSPPVRAYVLPGTFWQSRPRGTAVKPRRVNGEKIECGTRLGHIGSDPTRDRFDRPCCRDGIGNRKGHRLCLAVRPSLSSCCSPSWGLGARWEVMCFSSGTCCCFPSLLTDCCFTMRGVVATHWRVCVYCVRRGVAVALMDWPLVSCFVRPSVCVPNNKA